MRAISVDEFLAKTQPLGLDNKAIPQAPQSLPYENSAQSKGFFDGLGNELARFGANISQSVDKATNVANDLIEASPAYANIRNSMNFLRNDNEKQEALMRGKVSDLNNQMNGGLADKAINYAFNGEFMDKNQRFNYEKEVFNLIANNGFEPFVRIKNGEINYMGRDKNGTEYNFTPNFLDALSSSKGEIALSLLGGGSNLGAKTLTKIAPKIAQNTLARGVSNLASGGLGASIGAFSDFTSAQENTGYAQDFSTRVKNSAIRGVDDAMLGAIGGAVIGGAVKGYKGTKNLFSNTANKASEIYDGVRVGGENLGNRIIDKISSKDIPFVGKYTDGGLQNAENIANNLIKNNPDKDKIATMLNESNVYLENKKPSIEALKNFVEQGKNEHNPKFIQASSEKTSQFLDNLATTLQGYPTTQRREVLLRMAQAYPELKSFLDDVLSADKEAATKYITLAKENKDEFLKKANLDGELDIKAWQKDNALYENRINSEYANTIKQLDELNNHSIALNKKDFKALNDFLDNNFLEQDIKANIKGFLDEINGKKLNAEKLFALRSAINKQLSTGNKEYNTKQAYNIIKQTIDEALIRNAKDKELAKKILQDANKNYALKENFKSTYLGKKKEQETPEALIDRISKGARNINENKDLENAFKGMNEKELANNEKHILNATLSKYKVDDVGYDYVKMSEDLKGTNFKSKEAKTTKELIDKYAILYRNEKELLETALKSAGRKTNSTMATTIRGFIDRVLISGVAARLHALIPLVKSAKEQALRNQVLDALMVAKTHKEVVKNLKNIKISDEGQSKIFKNALNEYIKVNNEQNSKLKNALIKEGVIKGNGFFMDKPDPSKAKSDLNVKMKLEPNVRDLSKLSNDEIVADLEYLANKHKEMFNKPSDVFKLIREIKDNPTFFYKNNQLDIALIGKRLNDNKLGKLGINRNNNEIRHITKSRNADKENERILKRDGKDPLVESPYSTQLVLYKNAEPTANGADALSKGNNSNSTQEKPKKNLIQRLDDDIKAKEEAREKFMKDYKDELDKNVTISLLEEGKKVDTKNLIKVLETQQERGKNAIVIGRNNLNKELLEWLQNNDKIINIEKVDENLALKMGFKYLKDTKRSIDSSAIKHILKRHGESSELVTKSNMPTISLDDINRYLDYIDGANEQIIATDRSGNKVLVSFNQVNGHYVVVEQMRNKNNSLSLKTMFKGKGDYKNSKAYQDSIKNKTA